jgi:hypothetical protein
MYVFLHHDVLVHYKYGTVESAGWGWFFNLKNL